MPFTESNRAPRVEPDAVLEDNLDVADARDVGGDIAGHDHEIGGLAGFHTAGTVADSEVLGAVEGRDLHRFFHGESRIHQQLHLAVVGVPGNDAAVAGRVGPGDQRSPASTNAFSMAMFFSNTAAAWALVRWATRPHCRR